ncbi:MAG: hypothetical protein ACRYGR_08175 [Janthinobacterium lividum]
MNKKVILILISILISKTTFASLVEEVQENEYTQNQVNKIVKDTALTAYKKINENWSYIFPGKNFTPKVETQNWSAQYIKQIVLIEDEEAIITLPTLIYEGSIEKLGKDLENLIQNPAILTRVMFKRRVKKFKVLKTLEYHFGY